MNIKNEKISFLSTDSKMKRADIKILANEGIYESINGELTLNSFKKQTLTPVDKDLATKLSERNQRIVSIDAVRKLRQRLGIIKKSGRGRCELKDQ